MMTRNSFLRGVSGAFLSLYAALFFPNADAQSTTNKPPEVRIAIPQDGDVFAAPTDITMWVVGNDTDGWINTVEFFANGNSLGVTTNNPFVLSPINPFHLTWTNVPAGEHMLTAKATDNGGASAMSERVVGWTGKAPAEIMIVAAARDPDGWVHLVEFFSNGDKIGEQSIEFIQEPPPGQLQEFSFKWTDVRPGLYVLTTKATDDEGASSMSGPVAIVVVEANVPPIVTIRAVDSLAIEGTPPNTASFRVRRTGPTNEALLVFYSVSGTASNGVDYTELTGTVTIPAGRHSARIAVTPIDDELNERIESVVVTLGPSPVASPVEPYRVGFPRRAGAIIVDNDHPRGLTHCLPDGLLHLCLPGENGLVYRLECSANLVDWTPLCDSVVVDGAVHYVDTETANNRHCFYRVRAEVSLAVEADD